jgi:hypothetical protein
MGRLDMVLCCVLITFSLQSNQLQSSLRKSHSTICSGSGPAAEPYRPEMPGFIDRLEKQDDCSGVYCVYFVGVLVGFLLFS